MSSLSFAARRARILTFGLGRITHRPNFPLWRCDLGNRLGAKIGTRKVEQPVSFSQRRLGPPFLLHPAEDFVGQNCEG